MEVNHLGMMKECEKSIRLPKRIFEYTLSKGILNFWIYLLFELGREPCRPGYLIVDLEKMAEFNHVTPEVIELRIMSLKEMKMIQIKGNSIKIKNHSQYIGYRDEQKESLLNSNGSIDYPYKFIEFWKSYPMRNGKRLSRSKAFIEWKKIPVSRQEALERAVASYSSSGQMPMDAFRWLRKNPKTGDSPWEEWVTDNNVSIDESTNGGLINGIPSVELTRKLYGRSSDNGNKPKEPKSNKKYKQLYKKDNADK